MRKVSKVPIASFDKAKKYQIGKTEVLLKNGLDNCLKYAREVLK